MGLTPPTNGSSVSHVGAILIKGDKCLKSLEVTYLTKQNKNLHFAY